MTCGCERCDGGIVWTILSGDVMALWEQLVCWLMGLVVDLVRAE